MLLKTELMALIAEGKFEQVEERWMESLGGELAPVDDYLVVAQKLRKAKERSRSDALLDLLADALAEKGDWMDRVTVLCEIGRLSKRPSLLRDPLVEAITKGFGECPTFGRVLKVMKFDDKDTNLVETAEKAMNWLRFEVGETFFMVGRGAGIVTELNPELGVCRIDFSEIKRFSVPLGAASKHLESIGTDHILKGFFLDPEGFAKKVLASPADSFEQLLRSFGRPLDGSGVKDAFRGIVPANKWSSWWTAARKHPQIVASGAGAKATYQWKASSEAADEAILAKFDKARLKQKLDIARKQSGRSEKLADHFASQLVRQAEAIYKASPAEAWEILATLEKLPGSWKSEIDPLSLITGPGAARAIAGLNDRAFREKALDTLRSGDEDWVSVFAEVFFLEQDARVISRIVADLEGEGASEVIDRLMDETLRYPRRHPYAFVWYVEKMSEEEAVPERVGFGLVAQVIDALGSAEFASLKTRLKALFDKGGLAVRVMMEVDNEEQAKKLAESVERCGDLEAYRRQAVQAMMEMKYPALREADEEPILATAEAVAEKRREFDHLKRVEIPANLKAIQEARELGDLSENFEYKSARQRQEYLTARATALDGELRRVRVIEPSSVDPSQVRVGTRILLRNGDVEREVTILGRWESDPERGVYSHESDAGKALLGCRVGEVASFMGNDYLVAGIWRWTN